MAARNTFRKRFAAADPMQFDAANALASNLAGSMGRTSRKIRAAIETEILERESAFWARLDEVVAA